MPDLTRAECSRVNVQAQQSAGLYGHSYLDAAEGHASRECSRVIVQLAGAAVSGGCMGIESWVRQDGMHQPSNPSYC
jgi:hypothetical protein